MVSHEELRVERRNHVCLFATCVLFFEESILSPLDLYPQFTFATFKLRPLFLQRMYQCDTKSAMSLWGLLLSHPARIKPLGFSIKVLLDTSLDLGNSGFTPMYNCKQYHRLRHA